MMALHIKKIFRRIQTFVAGTCAVLMTATAAQYGYSAGSCDTNFEEHGVYEALVVYLIDEVVEGPVFLPIDEDRNTIEYRTEAYDFFRERFGLDFDPNDPNIQVISGPSGEANVFPLKTGVGSTHQVYGLDAQNIPQWRHRMPITNAAFFDDGFFVTLDTDYVVTGTFGGANGIVLPAGTQFVFGEYRMFDDSGQLLETFRYRSNIPVTAGPVGGSFEFSNGAVFINIACDIESKTFGHGNVRALAEVTPLADGRTDLDFRYVMKFPARLADDPSIRMPNCRKLQPVK
jgi:hypothetical protein